MNREPTVLDYIKSLFRGKPLAIPSLDEAPHPPQPEIEQVQEIPETLAEQPPPLAPPAPRSPKVSLPWRSLLALGLSLAA